MTECKHRNRRTLLESDYETSSSSGYLVRAGIKWCTNCGAWAYDTNHREEMKWHLPHQAKVD